MKTYFTNILIPVYAIIIMASVSSCSQDTELTGDAVSRTKVVNTRFTVNKIEFDSKGSTRSGGSGTGWSNGETIYLRFNNATTGTAVYNISSDNWNIKLNGSLQSTAKGKLEAYYFDNNPTVFSDRVSLSATKGIGIFHDTDGVYSYTTEGNLDIGIILKPLTSRIRFKGEGDDYISINEGITRYSSFSTSTFSLTATTEPIDLSPYYKGYTNYS